MTTYQQNISFGEMRASGVYHVLVHCRDHKCSHSTKISTDRLPDHVRLYAGAAASVVGLLRENFPARHLSDIRRSSGLSGPTQCA